MDFLDPPSIQPSLSKEEPGSGASSSTSLSDHFSLPAAAPVAPAAAEEPAQGCQVPIQHQTSLAGPQQVD